MKLLIKDTFFGITDITPQEKTLIENRFTYKDASQAMTKYGYKKEKVKSVKFTIKKENSLILRSGFLQEFLKFAKEFYFKVDEIKDNRTRFDFQKKDFSYDELRTYFNPNFKYVDHQIRALKALLKTNWGIIKAPTSAGKCFGKNTEILMFDGSIKKVQDIVVGDVIMGWDSNPRKVLSTTSGRDTLYKIKYIKSGGEHIVNSSHVLTLKSTRDLNKSITKNLVIDIPILEYIKQNKDFKRVFKLFQNPVTSWEKKEHGLDPYFLGIWLGDGRSDGPSITSIDEEVINYLYEYANRFKGLSISIYSQKERVNNYAITGNRKNKNEITEELKRLNLINNKHIPKEYLIDSYENRLSLLAGLLDTDGYLNKKRNVYQFSNKNINLANDVVFLARSLGFYVSIAESEKKSQNGISGKYQIIYITGDIWKIPTKIKRKQSIVRIKNKCELKDPTKIGFTIEDVGVGDYYGFTLDGDGRFMLGDFIVSHNTEIIIGLMKISKLPTLILVDNITLATQTMERLEEAGLNCGICTGQGKLNGTNMVSTIGSVKKLSLSQYQCVIVDECFPGRTMVHTENGMKPISSLVKSKSTEKVWSFNLSTKKYELNKIYDWYEKKTDNDLIEIWYNNRNSIRSTPNHKYFILENNEIIEKKAEDLVVGDRCIISPSYARGNGIAPRISKKQYQSILGMILGDGCLSKTKNLGRLRFSQGYKQLDYLKYKLSILDNMYFRKNVTIEKSGYSDSVVYNTATQSSVDFLDLYNKVYINGTKKICNIIKEIDEISLAFWIMDDGCLHNNQYYELSTHSFTKEENELIIKTLKEKFDISATIKYDKRINKYYLYITTDSSKTLSSLISPYVCNSMQYKLLEKDRNNFNFIIDDKIEYSINEIKKINKITPRFKTVYNISVENNHNYLVGNGVLVSNCHIVGAARFQEFFNKTSYPLRFGFSATPDGNDKYRFATIRQYIGDVIAEVYTDELMENDVITPPEIHFKQISCVPTMDWQAAYESNIVKHTDRNRIAADIANTSGVPTLVLYKIIDHGKELAKLIPDSILLSGDNDSAEREDAIHKFKKGEVRVLIASNIFKQGISINNIQTLINVSGGKSKIEVLQKLGRALRKHPGKDVALVYDFLDKGNDFTYKHSLQRMKLYRDAGYNNIILDKD